jgi:uncharacterized repeat protein (TIGR03803 family)
MKNTSSTPRNARALVATVVLLAGAPMAHSIDTYDPSSHQLTIPTLGIGFGTYSNVVLTVGSLLNGPTGELATGAEDAYNPSYNALIVPVVSVDSTTYYNPFISVGQLISVGSVSGTDSFDGTYLEVPYVQVGAMMYSNVVLRVSLADVVRVGEGMPSVWADQFDPKTGLLTIGAVRFGSRIYTNVVLNAGLPNVVAASAYFNVLHEFQGGADGSQPVAGLIMDAGGNLYGTAPSGGGSNLGTVFRLGPNGSGGYTFSVLYSFQGGADGANPQCTLIMDVSGNLYGTTKNGGSNGWGTVFRLAPNSNGEYTKRTLYSFQFIPDAMDPIAGLIMDKSGNLYGTTFDGGTNAYGTVFRLAPDGSGGYSESVLYSFNGIDGAGSNAGLIMDANGNLFGTCIGGGISGGGTVFELKPNGIGGYTSSLLHSFLDTADGVFAYSGLVMDAGGNLYGVAAAAGGNDEAGGTVYKFSPDGGGYTFSVIYTFDGGVVGDDLRGTLIIDKNGNLYGTAAAGGGATIGVVYKLAPNAAGGYSQRVLYSFTGPDGANPQGGLAMGVNGSLYGMTLYGGNTANGVVFRIE